MTSLTLKRKVSVPFPSLVTGAGGIKVSKSNGLWTIQPDFSQLGIISAAAVPDPSQKQIWIWDPVSGQYNVLTLAGLGDALYKLSSTTSLAIGTGSKTFVTQTNKDIGVGSWLLITSDALPNVNYMLGQVTSYDTAGNLVVNVTYSGGSGTHTDWTIRAASPPGSIGKSSGFSFAWLTSTASSDPGAGNVKANNATFASITSIFISETDADGNALAAEIAASLAGTSTVKSRLKIYDPLVPTNFMTFDVTALTDNGAWDTLTVTPVANGGTFTAAEGLRVSLTAKGDKGDTGTAGLHAGVAYSFATSTAMADPSSGNLRLNNAALSSVTSIAISANSADSGNPSVSAWINTFDDSTTPSHRGLLVIRKVAAQQNFAIYDVTANLTDNSTWLQLTVAYVVGSGSFSAADAVTVSFIRTGDRGAAGAGSGDMISTNNLSDVANKQTSYDNLSLHGADIASAATVNLDTATGYLVNITGTTSVTAITLADGKDRIVRFTGALTLTNGANLVLPGGANITTAAGDMALFVGFPTGVVLCVGYFPATTAGMRTLAAAAGLSVVNSFSKTQTAIPSALTSGSGADFSAGQNFTANVNGSTFTIANPSVAPADASYIAVLVTFTTANSLAFGTKYKTTGYAAGTSGKDHLLFRYDLGADLYYLVGVRNAVAS